MLSQIYLFVHFDSGSIWHDIKILQFRGWYVNLMRAGGTIPSANTTIASMGATYRNSVQVLMLLLRYQGQTGSEQGRVDFYEPNMEMSILFGPDCLEHLTQINFGHRFLISLFNRVKKR